METIRYSQIGKEDINFGTGTFEVRLADGRVVILNKVDLWTLLQDSSLISTRDSGTWTPSVGGTATYTTQVGRYTRIGNVVTFSCNLEILVLGTGSATVISGLPYTIKSNTRVVVPVFFTDSATNVVYMVAFGSGGNTSVSLRAITAADDDVLSSVTILTDGTSVVFSGSYLAED